MSRGLHGGCVEAMGELSCGVREVWLHDGGVGCVGEL